VLHRLAEPEVGAERQNRDQLGEPQATPVESGHGPTLRRATAGPLALPREGGERENGRWGVWRARLAAVESVVLHRRDLRVLERRTDIARFYRALLHEQLLSGNELRTMQTTFPAIPEPAPASASSRGARHVAPYGATREEQPDTSAAPGRAKTAAIRSS
jgi:hypothetical protein